VPEPEGSDRYRPLRDYALIGDCHTAALVSRGGSIDWCCLPRFDSGSAFARLLDHGRGGCCSVSPAGGGSWESTREYVEGTLVLATTFRGEEGEARLLDCFVMAGSDEDDRGGRILRVLEGRRGAVRFDVRVAPRFDYGEVRPWIRRHRELVHSAIGGNDALIVFCEQELQESPDHELAGRVTVGAGERIRLSLRYCAPELVERWVSQVPDPGALDAGLEQTVAWWREWSRGITLAGSDEEGVRRSAIVLKALTYKPTGAIVAAATTSLPEAIGGTRNWDYRYAWVRDASFSSRAFAELGSEEEADAFRAFVMRSAAGQAEDLQVLYGVGGERRLRAAELPALEGYRRCGPARVGNDAASQRQLDAYGELVNLTWRWHRRGQSPNDDDWRFLVSLIDHAARQAGEPDHGVWEWAGEPEHFVHSKVLCWAALERGLRLADECMRRAPTRRWKQARDALRQTIERCGYDRERGIYVQAYGRREVDAALLLLPTVEYVDWRDERILRTVAAVRRELDAGDGLLYRYRREDGLPGDEGAFLCCSFWLVECLARSGAIEEARSVFDRTVACANDVGLLSEEIDPTSGELLGNFPQGLTHLAHIDAAVALAETERSAVVVATRTP